MATKNEKNESISRSKHIKCIRAFVSACAILFYFIFVYFSIITYFSILHNHYFKTLISESQIIYSIIYFIKI